jgi:two-component system, cell cycle sensor histidine kinase and response regulator CckA
MPVEPAAKSAGKTSALRLLHVEHESADLELCHRALQKSGLAFEVETATTPEELAQKLRDHPFDVVLSDYRLPGWTGMEALARIKESGHDLPVILVTGTLGEELAVQCIREGITDYVLKDQLARLPVAIQRAQEEKQSREAERRAVKALRDSEARYRGLVENATYGIYWVTLAGELLDANPALVQMLGYSNVEEFLGLRNSSHLFRDLVARQKLLERYLAEGHIDAVVEWKQKDGKLISVRLNGRRARDSVKNSDCLEVIVENITERVGLEKQLAQAQKFEAIGQLAGGITHDFNNMIGAIIGWADLGMEETESSSRLHRHFQKMRQQADRAAALTRQLLAFARRKILEPRNIDLNQTSTETLSLLEKVIGSNIAVKRNFSRDLAVVCADPSQVEQILMNLCINARDAMPNGGSLIIETRNATIDDGYCASHPFAHPGEYAMLAVTDSGTGMDAATLDRIFEPFFTTKGHGKGTGLGLATVYGIVRQHGGFIHVYSEVNVGTTFHVYLPVSAQPVKSAERPVDSKPVQGGKEVILIAEDHEGLREIARESLSNLGYRIILATDGEQAVTEFLAHRNEIDLLLMDVVLPKLAGPEAYARIRESGADVPVIFATGYSADIALLERARSQSLPMLQKPYSPRDLARKVRDTLDQHQSRLVPHR